MDKRKYETVEIEIISKVEDVITASSPPVNLPVVPF